jgi:S-adenosylmethionine:tRNA ribosyltransferase-isomerase
VLLLDQRDDGTWEALARPSASLRDGVRLRPEHPQGAAADLEVEVLDDLGEGRRLVRLHLPDDVDELHALEAAGEVPLPPYITAHLADPERYQTVYAVRPASAAAPTAGLHFTPAVLRGLAERDIRIARVELVVGLGTFRPITAERVEDHHMHAERFRVPSDVLFAVDETHRDGRDVVAIGTTVVRALETAAVTGRLTGTTDLFIHGQYHFAAVDRLLTNFHLPRSSLLVMIEAFMGPRWRHLYAEAVEAQYRFLSFGDAMLLSRAER